MARQSHKKYEFEQIVVDVTVASKMTEAQKKTIETLVAKAVGAKTALLNIKYDAGLLGGLQLQVGSCLIDASVRAKLSKIENILETARLKKTTPEDFEQILKTWADNNLLAPKVENVGRVLSVKDGIARVQGMNRVKAGELIRFNDTVAGIVFTVNKNYTDVVLLAEAGALDEGDLAVQTGDVVRVPVGMSLIGRVVDALGTPIDGLGDLNAEMKMPLEAPVAGIVERQPVCKPFPTGLKVIDALVPIGLGQRELVVGDRQTGKTSILIDAILNQKEHNLQAKKPQDKIYCIYVAIGQKQSTVAELVRLLQESGAMDYTCVVSASASDTAALQYAAPFTGTTIAEYFRDRSMNAVVFYDDLTKHANAYRQISLLLRRPPGREAYPGDIFYLHSRLLERAAMMSDDKGGGSLTAIPVVETQEGDLSAYIPTNVISITDGQIFLENSLFNQGVRPAVNVGLSVSRVGSQAQRPLMAKIAGSMKLELAQYREMLSFAQIASDLDSSTQELLHKGVRMTEVLKQPVHKPLAFVDEYLSLYAVSNGFYVGVKPADIAAIEQGLIDKMHTHYPDLIDAIDRAGKELPAACKKQLDEAIREVITEVMANEQRK